MSNTWNMKMRENEMVIMDPSLYELYVLQIYNIQDVVIQYKQYAYEMQWK